ncbi:MAG TPA: hypothetical protein VIY27_02490 [Myxococcota bacterium]
MGEDSPELRGYVAAELFGEPPEGAVRLAREIRERHAGAVSAVVFYGSCLRKMTLEGVLDFYALVDDYSRAYASRPAAWLNAAFPPSVFYVECKTPGGVLRAKYAVMSGRDFARAASGRSVRSGVWARFCQPAQVVWARDAEARDAVASCVARAVRTAVQCALPLLPDEDGAQRFDARSLWQALFRETYAAEMRPERDETIRSLYDAAPQHYARALSAGLASLAEGGRVEVRQAGDAWIVTHRPGQLRKARRARRVRRPAAKLLALVQLLKSACTFGDWLPYALWKLERHTGTRLTPTARQRRHPFVFGWPLILQILRRRDLR